MTIQSAVNWLAASPGSCVTASLLVLLLLALYERRWEERRGAMAPAEPDEAREASSPR